MPKLSSLVSLGTAGKVASGIIVGGVSTVAVQRYTDSSEFSKDPQRAEMREEGRKKLDFEIQQRSEELEKKKRELEVLAETIAKQQAALKEERSAVQQMQQAATQVVASEVPVVETVQQVAQVEESEEPKSEESKKAEVPTNNAPKRPAVFDGGGNKEPIVPANDAQKPAVAFGSSGDVVTVGNADNAGMIDRLREEIEDLRRRLAEKDGSPKEEALRAREERLRERERALSEKLWKSNMQSKATQTDDALFEAASEDDDPFEGGSKKKTAKSGKVVDFFTMEKEEVQAYAVKEGERLSKDIAKQEDFFRQLVSVEETMSVGTATKEEQEKRVREKTHNFNELVKGTMGTLPSDVAQTSIDQILQSVDNDQRRAALKKNLERVKRAMPFLKDVKTLGALRAAVSAYTGIVEEKPISPQKYADLMEESAAECAQEITNPVSSNDAKKREADAAKEFKRFCDTKDASNKKASEIVGKENAGGGVDPAQAIADLKKEAADGYDAFFDGKNGLLKGFHDLQHDWEQLVALGKTVKSIPAAPGVPGVPPPPPGVPGVPAGGNSLFLSDDKEDFAKFLSIVDPDFRDKNRKNTEAHDEALQARRVAIRKIEKAKNEHEKAVKDGRDDAEKNRLLNEMSLAEKELEDATAAAGAALKTWKDFRTDAFNDLKKRLLAAQARWLDCGFEGESSIDSTITDLKDRLSKDAAQPTGAALLRQQRISGTAAAVTRLTDPEKEKYKKFLDTAKSVKKRASDLKEKFNRAKETKEAVERVSFKPVTNPGTGEVRYVVSIPDGSLLSSASLYSCLLSLAPVITELTIEKLGYESAGKPFLNFMKLCPRFALLEKLCIKGSFAEDVRDSAKKGFFRQYESAIRSDDERLGSLRGSGIPSNAKGFFFRAISLIPNLKTFEMYCV